ncbi:PREDICTED: probable RNA methyltransferase CG11342 isoform X2 [Ceratosolen solmsi marchali]|uniref:RNA methyltransferase n=1 Tax=Ceratosolen solmsi marchali TaxID=326594 RepID=A0AAJ6VLV8_9HYME|nr:PREDICTED: probable RNA methyltransferase CG11342 isoform X2 [Ceratosolen solmsi marchali]
MILLKSMSALDAISSRMSKPVDAGSSRSEPGASRHGNFIDYYRFHPAEERMRQIPEAIYESAGPSPMFVALDIGCNTGDLTLELYKFLSKNLPERKISIIGIDLDPVLIERAQEKNDQFESVTFVCIDFFSNDRENVLSSYLSERHKKRFDASFCFSITMWIHLNKGDAGLELFLRDVCSCSEVVLVEPQPWRCYRSAARRLRRANLGDFPLLEGLEYRDEVQRHIEKILRDQCKFRRLHVSEKNEWQRRLILYKRCHDERTHEDSA